MTKFVRIGVGLAMVAIGAGIAFGSGSPVQAASPIVTITPAQQSVAIGASTVTYTVSVSGVTNMAAYGINVQFDHYVLQFASAQNGAFLASSGRSVTCPGAVLSPDQDTVQYGCVTVGDLNGVGAVGSGVLATLTFTLVGGGTSPLTFTRIDLTDAGADGICDGGALCTPQIGQGGSITVDGPLLPRPTVDPNATATPAPGVFQTPTSVIGGAGDATTATANDTATSGTTPAAVGTVTSGTTSADGTTAAGGATPGGGTTAGSGTLGVTALPDSTGSAGGSAGSTSSSGSSGTSTGVGHFGYGPDSYANKNADMYRTRAIALAALGFALIVAGLWREKTSFRRQHRR